MRSLGQFWRRRLPWLVAISAGLGAACFAIAVTGAWGWALLVLVSGVVGIQLLLWRWQRHFRESLDFWSAEIARSLEQVSMGLLAVRFAPEDFPEELRGLLQRLNSVLERVEGELGRVRKLERIRSEFLGNVSHELRNPLFALRGYLEALVEFPVEETAREFAHKALSHAQRLETLLTRLLELSQIESGAARMRMRVFELGELVRQVLAVFEERARQWGLRLEFDGPEEPVEVVADRERIEQVLLNLVDNAIKYNRSGGLVRVRLQPQGKTVMVEVADTGVGIPKEYQDRVFERFYRVRSSPALDAEGSGLGLAIVKHILEAHQAPYELESAPGVGTRFRFWLRC